MKYFAKYLPVEDKPKVGDSILNGTRVYKATIVDMDEVDIKRSSTLPLFKRYRGR